MNNLVKKHFKLGMAAIIGVSVFTISNFASAADNNYLFDFDLKPNYGNTYSAYKYRETNSSSNPWKVDFRHNDEGSGTFATFWLDSAGVVAGPHDQKVGTKIYYGGTSSANNKDVRLGAENNNDSPRSYGVSGYWDEETW